MNDAANDNVANSPAVPPRQLRPSRTIAARASGLLFWIVMAYAAAIALLWAWMYWDGDRGWLATVFLFSPRSLCLLPLIPLALAAAVYRRALLAPLAGTAGIILVGIMGLQVHLPSISETNPTLRVMTCNVDEHSFRIASLAELIETEQPDVVALQEIRQYTPFVWPAGWHVLEQDQFILASRWPIADRGHGRRLEPRDIGVIRYVVQAPGRDIEVFNLHLSTPRPGLEAVLSRATIIDPAGAAVLKDVLELRDAESEYLSGWVANFPAAKIIVGDFNMPTESAIFRRCWSRWSDAFSTAGVGFGFTKITGTGLLSYGARIDHILFSPPWRCLRCWVGPDIGSDHRPLLAEFEWGTGTP